MSRISLIALGAVNGLLAFMIVFVFRIGPVIFTLSQSHGIHSGDFIAVPLALLGAACFVKAVSGPLHLSSKEKQDVAV